MKAIWRKISRNCNFHSQLRFNFLYLRLSHYVTLFLKITAFSCNFGYVSHNCNCICHSCDIIAISDFISHFIFQTLWCYTVRKYGQKCTLGVQQLVNGAVALKRQPCTLSTTIVNAIRLQLYFLFETAPRCVSDAETVFNSTHTQRQFFP